MTISTLMKLENRSDVFLVDCDRRMTYAFLAALLFGLLLGLRLQTLIMVNVQPETYETLPSHIIMTIAPNQRIPVEIKPSADRRKPPHTAFRISNKGLGSSFLPPSNTRANNRNFGTGDINQRVNQSGLLILLSGTGTASGFSGQTMPVIHTKDIDDALRHISAVKTSGKAAFGRKGLSHGNDLDGYIGIGGSAGGIDDLLPGMIGEIAIRPNLSVKQRDIGIEAVPDIWHSGESFSGRSPRDIRHVVTQHLGGLRYEYNKRLRDNPELKGKITVKFTISQSGKVLSCRVVESTMDDPALEQAVVGKIRGWEFGACGNCGIATVTYPFAFSQ